MMLRLSPALFVFLWATGFIGAKLGAPYAEPMTFLTIRFAMVVPVMAVIALALSSSWPDRRGSIHAFIVGTLIHGMYLGAVFWAIDHGLSAGASALIVGLQPVTTAFLAAPLLGERVTRTMVIGLVLGTIGVVLVLLPRTDLANSGATLATVGVCVAGLLAVTLGTIYQKRFATGIDLVTGAVWQYLGALLFVGTLALVTETGVVEWHIEFIVALLWSAAVLSIGAVTLLMFLIRRSDVSRVATLLYLVPAVVAVIAYVLFDERLAPLQFVGMACVALAVILASRQPASNNR
ncbi:MAG: DMT family transporter [Pseudomonadota bacterium]